MNPAPDVVNYVDSTSTGLVCGDVEGQIHDAYMLLATDAVELSQITPSLMAVYSLGYEQGQRSQAQKLAQAEWDARRFYLAAFNPNDRHALLDARMRAAADRLPDDMLADSVEGVHGTLTDALGGAA